jgi:hypothetical protein
MPAPTRSNLARKVRPLQTISGTSSTLHQAMWLRHHILLSLASGFRYMKVISFYAIIP